MMFRIVFLSYVFILLLSGFSVNNFCFVKYHQNRCYDHLYSFNLDNCNLWYHVHQCCIEFSTQGYNSSDVNLSKYMYYFLSFTFSDLIYSFSDHRVLCENILISLDLVFPSFVRSPPFLV